MKRCNKCILPSSFPRLTLKNGLCDFCRKEKYDKIRSVQKNSLGKEKLLETLNSKKTGKYDCLVPLSGGKDSSYVLYYLVKKLNLNPVAVAHNNGFLSKYAKQNIKNLCNKLNVDLIMTQSNKFYKKQIEASFDIFKMTKGRRWSCGNCKNDIRQSILKEAIKREIPFIIWGASDYEDYPLWTNKSYREMSDKLIPELKRIIGWLIDKPNIITSIRWLGILPYRKFLFYYILDNLSIKNPTLVGPIKLHNRQDVEVIYFYDYIKYNIYEQIDKLKNNLNWESIPEIEDKLDCELSFFLNYFRLKTTGITGNGARLSNLVRNGIISREKAMKKEKHLEKYLKNNIKDKLQQINTF